MLDKPNSQEDSRVWKKKITGLIEGTHFAAFFPPAAKPS